MYLSIDLLRTGFPTQANSTSEVDMVISNLSLY